MSTALRKRPKFLAGAAARPPSPLHLAHPWRTGPFRIGNGDTFR